ncbi:MAG: hypothetical protein FWG13_03480 [Leptospirales bacterium]|nr:hypothetical protein [Leptospirales bacterium]
MQNIRYHLINIAAVTLFSWSAAGAINQSVQYALSPSYNAPVQKQARTGQKTAPEISQDDLISPILASGIFKIANESSLPSAPGSARDASLPNLTLLGTITGPAAISRALIRKDGEKDPKIYALHKINNDISNDVYGYKLVAIDTNKVWLENNGQRSVLELFVKNKPSPQSNPQEQQQTRVTKTMSRAEIKQNTMNDIDNAMKGIVGGPYRKNGKLDGYVLKTVSQENILYQLGLRNGDIVKRVNGKELNSMEKLIAMWPTMQNETKITADVERGGRMMTFDLNITE